MGREQRDEDDPIPVQDPTKTGGNIPVGQRPDEGSEVESEPYEGDADDDDQDDDDDDDDEDDDDSEEDAKE